MNRYSAFADELMKISYGPPIFHTDRMPEGAGGYFDPSMMYLEALPDSLGRHVPGKEGRPGRSTGRGLVALRPPPSPSTPPADATPFAKRYAKAREEQLRSSYKIARAHELTHWLRAKKGTDLPVRSGFKGVIGSVKAEMAAYAASMRHARSPLHKFAKMVSFVPEVLGSVANTHTLRPWPR